jgi:hypothetical protein
MMGISIKAKDLLTKHYLQDIVLIAERGTKTKTWFPMVPIFKKFTLN